MQTSASKIAIATLTLALLAGCSSSGPEQPAAPTESKTPVAPSGPSGTPVAPPAVSGKTMTPEEALMASLKDPNSPLSKRIIYFDYDSYAIKDSYASLISAHAKVLAANPKLKMLIQGNTDERGSREYNLALGQRRAEAVKRSLMLLGVQEAQIESVSLGEEKPRMEGSDEAAYAENRRSEMLYSGEF
ncbi:peptidoglycan-associated lipoprotein Pal [Methyloversatilis sp.]|uniref:peptidoglycan-associated lipoprotein Pal n=1 Tax=Methyloversatilis sp. TaxID=2569862 RepID=UPI002734C315|nr:peptidoglycan-associated lipoprotein Pal [Methyloversatilis sp.]MDP2870420.1 peptidoglycan-associated lipoprotein Pal [Methyloversatilis sp.]MDP3453975.1 peptidoglycan-associated lipoprotein Pal [Methyloversatilis sp.]MDP3578773.1 peptidoglycan-associated lipoprotein Pal [Methyloversatilis sp.]